MAYKKVVVMKVAVLALVRALSATEISARPDVHVLDLFHLLSAAKNHASDNFVRVVHGKNKGNSIACYDACTCIRSQPPQCKCNDIFRNEDRCEGCGLCICTFSIPPIRMCTDTTDSCSPLCSADAAANSVLKTKVALN
ncbi:hypothetical protein FEM48_Zijuj05G0084400 [Ziziphus jujuba var. spinosa]|uniref:Bowman-Birk serine protease inhibitors family domain-containing protein n=1 Tax=Ziziphus jujuba var. spinosa TaxID=714518 RepID=A0A978VDW5_ZIZJJ|nr:hypothetical protein FEM48_Zijuj05G0084400 [Ziziphus jujuba var. spinosa]